MSFYFFKFRDIEGVRAKSSSGFSSGVFNVTILKLYYIRGDVIYTYIIISGDHLNFSSKLAFKSRL
jgi:hypothetical protein